MNLKIPIFFLNVDIFFTEAKLKKKQKISKNWRRKKRIIKFKIEHPTFLLKYYSTVWRGKKRVFPFFNISFCFRKRKPTTTESIKENVEKGNVYINIICKMFYTLFLEIDTKDYIFFKIL